ncbi:hypothetical protein ACI5KX_10530 [Erythrobacter sp. GH1-10]|uniref:hypothetical protein n=1 Tax=Erythrobacter sp. GH1-10 TaxID=3349334 RepID=UPI003877B235
MKRLVAAAVALSLGACASPYVGKPYSAPATPLTEVAVAGDILPEEVVAYEAASVGSNFGLLGALIDSGV